MSGTEVAMLPRYGAPILVQDIQSGDRIPT